MRPMDHRDVIRRAARAARVGRVLPLPLTARLYGGTDKWFHGYTQPYHDQLARLRRQRITVLEIGIGGYDRGPGGGSLRIWRDWFPRATVVGVDIEPKRPKLGPRVHAVQGDQADPVVLDRAVSLGAGPLSVVIDDGSHVGSDVLASFRHLFPRLRPGGVYIVEDLHTSYWPEFGGGVPAPEVTGVGLIQQIVDAVQVTDPTFDRYPARDRPSSDLPTAAALHVHPGTAIVIRG